MATGDNIGPKRPRYQANQRFDVGDAEAASRAPVEHLDSFQRALITTPRAAGGALLPGMIVTGMSLTPNPVAADGKVRINSELGIAIDANGRFIIKPDTVTVDVSIPAGGPYQLYVYWQETPTDVATRRFLTVQAPFTEFPDAIPTALQSTYGTHVRAGDATTTVKEDIINGVMTPLVCIGIITSNTAGVIAITGYNAVTAPNGTSVTNRISTVTRPSVLPNNAPTRNGSPQTMHDLINLHAFMRGRQAFWGSRKKLTAYTGSTTSVASLTLNDTNKAWIVDDLIGCEVQDFAGTFWRVASNTATSITFSDPGGAPTPAAGAYTVWGPAVSNNYGAYERPTRSIQQMSDTWDDYFDAVGNLSQLDGQYIQQTSTGGYRFSGIATTYVPLTIGGAHIPPVGTVQNAPDYPIARVSGSMTSGNGVFIPLVHGLPDFAYLDNIRIVCAAAPAAQVRLRIYEGAASWVYLGMEESGDGVATSFDFPFDAVLGGVKPLWLQIYITTGIDCDLAWAEFDWHVE